MAASDGHLRTVSILNCEESSSEEKMSGLPFVNPATYLSPRVRRIICQPPMTSLTPSVSLFNGSVLSWSALERKINVSDMETPVDSFEYFEMLSLDLSPCFHEAEIKLNGIDPQTFEEMYIHLLKWTNSQNVLVNCFKALKDDTDGTGIIQSLLLSTAILERSLGNVYLTRGSQCPSMLKDLLLTSELHDIFGTTAIKVLRLFMGPSVSLNLRNVVWHGFPQPGEIPKRFGYMMIIIAASLGRILESKGITPESIAQRPLIMFPQLTYMHKVSSSQGWIPLAHIARESCCIPPPMLSLWEEAIGSYSREGFGVAVSLMLPQMEHMVRRIFAAVNECPNRTLTAENTVLFTTFDEMLDKTLPDGSENHLTGFLGNNVMDLIMDLLAYPNGPRVRDRVSHGETDIEKFPRGLVDQVFLVCAVMCIKCIPSESSLHEGPFVKAIMSSVDTYESVFFPINVEKRKLRELVVYLNGWVGIPKPTTDDNQEELNKSLWLDTDPKPLEERDVYTAAIHIIEQYLPGERQLARCVAPFTDIQNEFEPVLSRQIATLYRWKDGEALCPSNQTSKAPISGSESELVGYISRIIAHTHDISEQVYDIMESRYGQWQRKELRSRQRNTYMKMIDSVPALSSNLRLIAVIMTILLASLDDQVVRRQDERIRIVKKLRVILQYCENLKTYTSPAKNKWDDAVQNTRELLKRLSPS